MNQAEFLLKLVQGWGILGTMVAIPFLTFGMDQVDEDARGAYVFRLLIVPGVLLIWPLVLWRWYVLANGRDVWAARYRPPRKAHSAFALIMPVCILGLIGAGLMVRQTWPADIAPVQLTPPAQAAQ